MNHLETYAERQEGAIIELKLGDLLEESSQRNLGLRLYGSNRHVVPTMVCVCGNGIENAADSAYGCNEIPNR